MKFAKWVACLMFIFCFKISSQDVKSKLRIIVTPPEDKISYENQVLLSSYFSPEVLEYYLKSYKSSNVNIKDFRGRTPLILAASEGRVESVEVLLKNNADVNAADNEGKTALMHALECNHFNIAKILLLQSSNKIDLNQRDLNGDDISFYVQISQTKVEDSSISLIDIIRIIRNQIKENDQEEDLGGFCSIL